LHTPFERAQLGCSPRAPCASTSCPGRDSAEPRCTMHPGTGKSSGYSITAKEQSLFSLRSGTGNFLGEFIVNDC
jgi:hypothetical protein